MCFSISMAKTADEIAKAFGVFSGDIPPLPEYYHVSGFTYPDVPVLYQSSGMKTIGLMKWGLVPPWIKSADDADSIRSKTLNARSETADTLPSFKGSFKKGRCLVITDGFYEPHHRGRESYPFFIRRKDSGIIPLAGLYSVSFPAGEKLLSFSILTLSASPSIAEIHNRKKRMPFIVPLDSDFISRWLDPDLSPDNVRKLFEDNRVSEVSVSSGSGFEAYPVTREIYRKSSMDGPTVHERISYPELEEGLLPF